MEDCVCVVSGEVVNATMSLLRYICSISIVSLPILWSAFVFAAHAAADLRWMKTKEMADNER
jgi:hypothetical protein